MHSSGKIHRKGGGNPDDWAKMQKSIVRENQRCIYENEDISAMHSIELFPDGTKEAIIAVHTLSNGKIVKTESGATRID